MQEMECHRHWTQAGKSLPVSQLLDKKNIGKLGLTYSTCLSAGALPLSVKLYFGPTDMHVYRYVYA